MQWSKVGECNGCFQVEEEREKVDKSMGKEGDWSSIRRDGGRRVRLQERK